MGTENSAGASRQIPVVTLLVIASGIVTYLIPGLASHMVYDRAAILAGEGWRLFTGNWVHFSPSHLLYDLLAFGIAGWIIERRGYPYFGLLCALSALSISTVLLAMRPEMQFYGGLSGVATAAIVYLALHGLEGPGPWRWICVAALALSIGKILLESATGQLTFAAVDRIPFVPVPLSHVVGGVTASLLFWWSTASTPSPSPLTLPSPPLGERIKERGISRGGMGGRIKERGSVLANSRPQLAQAAASPKARAASGTLD